MRFVLRSARGIATRQDDRLAHSHREDAVERFGDSPVTRRVILVPRVQICPVARDSAEPVALRSGRE
jgi:hypothetical protein